MTDRDRIISDAVLDRALRERRLFREEGLLSSIDAHSFAYLSFGGDSHSKDWLECKNPTCVERRRLFS